MKKYNLYLNKKMIKTLIHLLILLQLISFDNCLDLTGFNNTLIKTIQANSGVK
jgi:hypothetical protein